MQDEDETNADRLRKQRASLADFGLKAFRTRDLVQVLHEGAKLVSEALDVKLVKVLELLPGGRELVVRAGVNWKPGVVGKTKIGADSESPAGYALRTNEPVISPNVETEKRFRIPDVLVDHGVKSMVNVIIAGEGTPYGVLEVDSTRYSPFDQDDIDFLQTYANLLAAAIDRHRKDEKLAEAAKERDLLLRELRHRMRNILTLVHALAAQTDAQDRSAEEFRTAFLGRLQALVHAEQVAFEERGEGIPLRELVERVLEPHLTDSPEAVVVEGESLILPSNLGMMLSLVIHELATNVSKYGSLSQSGGKVRVAWDAMHDPDHVCIVWQEQGGPVVEQPRTAGFGTRLVEHTCSSQLGGRAEFVYAEEGLTCSIDIPLA
jgi:two-component sensor histidine kinase